MHRELPLYIFIKNTILLCLVFFGTSAIIIERGRIERGENLILNRILIKQKDIRDYNNFEITNSHETVPISENKNIPVSNDSLAEPFRNSSFSSVLVDNGSHDFTVFIKEDL
jgi:hypothetical protein